jgi:exodeoxyribonuclease VII small subunit
MSEWPEENSEPGKKGPEIQDFEAALTRLEEIVQLLEGGELSLEEAMRLFEEGVKLSGFCEKRLDEAERKVEILIKRGRQGFQTEAFEESDEDDGIE